MVDMNRVKKILASIALTFGVMLGATVVAPVATAAPAHAVTMTQCTYRTVLGNLGGNYVWVRQANCYYDYNWWEEWNGWRDGWYFTTVPIYT
jgi:hypothetical protein